MQRPPMLMDCKNIVKMSILSKASYRFNIISIKILLNILHRTRENNAKIHTEAQKIWSNQSNLMERTKLEASQYLISMHTVELHQPKHLSFFHGKNMKKREFIHCYWECKLQPLWTTVWTFLRKLKTDIPFIQLPATPLLGIYPKKMNQPIKEIPACPFLLQHYSQQAKYKTKLGDHQQMDKENAENAPSGILLSYKKNEILLSPAKWMEVEDMMFSEIRQTYQDKYYMFTLTCRS